MYLGVQYYRAPFPEERYWEDDFGRIKDSGLNTMQLWVIWTWVESKPGQFCFDDYDRLIELADKNGLGVILSTIAGIQPYWIHREIPGSEMIDQPGPEGHFFQPLRMSFWPHTGWMYRPSGRLG